MNGATQRFSWEVETSKHLACLATVGERKGLQEEGSYRTKGREEMFASETFSKSLFINSLGLSHSG